MNTTPKIGEKILMMKTIYLFLFALFITNITLATIHYKYVNEEVNGSSVRYYDMNLDGDNDFEFAFSNSAHRIFNSLYQIDKNFYAVGSLGSVVKAYSEGSAMGTHDWYGGIAGWEALTYGRLTGPGGYFNDATKYIMVKFIAGTNTYYGWFLINHVASGDILYVVSYAYSDIPDEVLIAGQGNPTDIRETFSPVSPTFSLANLTKSEVSFQNCANYDKVYIYTMEGRQIAEIDQPVSLRQYSIKQYNHYSVLLFLFFDKSSLQYMVKHLIIDNA